MEFPRRDLYFSKRERHGLYFMLGCIFLLFTSITLFKFINKPTTFEYEEIELNSITKIINLDSVSSEKLVDKKINKKKAFAFNPNTTPLDSLKNLPIPSAIATRIDKYRSKGGKFKSKEDLKKIYGIEKHWHKIENHITISTPKKVVKSMKNQEIVTTKSNDIKLIVPQGDSTNQKEVMDSSSAINLKIDTTQFLNKKPKTYILTGEDRIEINTANEYNIQLVNGIGEYYAEKIIKYKEKVGGFHNLQILSKVIKRKEVLEKILPQLTCDPTRIQKQNINNIPYENLALVPEVGYKKATIMHRYIRNHFPLTDPEDLKKIGIFKDQQIEILLHYLKFED